MRVFKTRQNLFAIEMRIRSQNIVYRLTGSKLFKNKLDGDTCTFYNWFADHYIWVYFNQMFHNYKILLYAKALDIFPRHFFQLRIRRNYVQDRLHVAVVVWGVDHLFEVERAAFDVV